MNQNIRLQGLLAMLGMCLLGAFMCMGSPAIADVAVKVEKVAIEPKDDEGEIPNSKKTMKITLNKAVKAVHVPIHYFSKDAKVGENIDSAANSADRLRASIVTIIEEATGSGKVWHVKIERLQIGERIDPHGNFGMNAPTDKSKRGIVGPITIKWTNMDGTPGGAYIALLALAKSVKRKDGTIEDRVISVALNPQ